MGMQINIEITEINMWEIEKELNINIKKQNLSKVKDIHIGRCPSYVSDRPTDQLFADHATRTGLHSASTSR